jgi:hypothetical protein
VRDAHKRIDPKLEPVTGDPGHSVACLLTTEVRSRIWRGLQEGEAPGQLRHLVIEEDQPVRAHAAHSSPPELTAENGAPEIEP